MPIPVALRQPNQTVNYAKPDYPSVYFSFNNKLQANHAVGISGVFSRPSTAYRQDGSQVAAGIFRFEAGKFAQAMMVEEGTTNLLTENQASVETDTTGFSVTWDGSLSRDTTQSLHGSASLKCTLATAGNRQGWSAICNASAAAGETATATVWLKGDASLAGKACEVRFGKSGVGGEFSSVAVTITQSWQKVTISYTFSVDVTTMYLYAGTVDGTGVPVDAAFWTDMLQVEKKPYPTSWQLPGSARAAETLTVPTVGTFNLREGAIELYVYLSRSPGTNEQFIFDGAGSTNRNLQVVIRVDGKVDVRYGIGGSVATITSAIALIKETWYAIAWRWSNAGVALFVNGTNKVYSTIAPAIALGASAYYGSNADGSLQLDGLIDSGRIFYHARADMDIMDTYKTSEV